MQFINAISLLVAAVAVSAAPTGEFGAPAGSVQACGNGQVTSCCNTGASNIPVLGGNCELAVLGQACAGNQAFCCNADQNGLVNIGSICLPLTL